MLKEILEEVKSKDIKEKEDKLTKSMKLTSKGWEELKNNISKWLKIKFSKDGEIEVGYHEKEQVITYNPKDGEMHSSDDLYNLITKFFIK